MLENRHLVDAHGDSFPSAVIRIYKQRSTSIKQVEEVFESDFIDDSWVDSDSQEESSPKYTFNVKFKAEYWTDRQKCLSGKMSRKLLGVDGEEWFEVKFTEEDNETFENGFNEDATVSQKLAHICYSKLEKEILPALRG